MPEIRRKYDPDFKTGIVNETGKPIAQAARGLEVNEGTLANWVNLARVAEEKASDGQLAESEVLYGRRVLIVDVTPDTLGLCAAWVKLERTWAATLTRGAAMLAGTISESHEHTSSDGVEGQGAVTLAATGRGSRQRGRR